MGNLDLYTSVRAVPDGAKRAIAAGRLKGKTDINPMWRIKKLTEIFGPVGTGWRYEITNKATLNGANGEIAAFVDINLFYKTDHGWSEPIPGTGGSMFVEKEKNGMHTNDECFKMALTDAISVAAKAIGVGADVYWDRDPTKYEEKGETEHHSLKCDECGSEIKGVLFKGSPLSAQEFADMYGKCLSCVKKSGDMK